jgi:hypothetical protein
MSAPLDVAILIRDDRGQRVTTLASFFTDESITGSNQVREVFCFVPRLPLLAGQYRLDLWCASSSQLQDELDDAATLRVEPGNYFGAKKDTRLPVASKHGACMIPQRWSAAGVPAAAVGQKSRERRCHGEQSKR